MASVFFRIYQIFNIEHVLMVWKIKYIKNTQNHILNYQKCNHNRNKHKIRLGKKNTKMLTMVVQLWAIKKCFLLFPENNTTPGLGGDGSMVLIFLNEKKAV